MMMGVYDFGLPIAEALASMSPYLKMGAYHSMLARLLRERTQEIFIFSTQQLKERLYG